VDEERWAYLLALDDELLVGAAWVSEWASFLIRQADIAYAAHADVAAILTAQAAIEALLRYTLTSTKPRSSFFALIDASAFPTEIKAELHALRQFRNTWVHIADPEDDLELLVDPEHHEELNAAMAKKCMRLARYVAYSDQLL
jgi:hypothetical protein